MKGERASSAEGMRREARGARRTPSLSPEEAALVDAVSEALAGDGDWYLRWNHAVRPGTVSRLANWSGLQTDTIEDVIDEAVLRLVRRGGATRRIDDAGAWLATTMGWLIEKRRAHRARRPHALLGDVPTDALDPTAVAALREESEREREARDTVAEEDRCRLFSTLPRRHAEALVLHEIQSMTVTQTAEVFRLRYGLGSCKNNCCIRPAAAVAGGVARRLWP